MKILLSSTALLGLCGLASALPASQSSSPSPSSQPAAPQTEAASPPSNSPSATILPQGDPPKKQNSEDPYNFLFPASGEWLKKTCDIPGIDDDTVDPKKRWELAGASGTYSIYPVPFMMNYHSEYFIWSVLIYDLSNACRSMGPAYERF